MPIKRPSSTQPPHSSKTVQPTLLWQTAELAISSGLSWLSLRDCQNGAHLFRLNRPSELGRFLKQLQAFNKNVLAGRNDLTTVSPSGHTFMGEDTGGHVRIRLLAPGGRELQASSSQLADLEAWLKLCCCGDPGSGSRIFKKGKGRAELGQVAYTTLGGSTLELDLGHGNAAILSELLFEAAAAAPLPAARNVLQRELHNNKYIALWSEGSSHFDLSVDTSCGRVEAVLSRTELACLALDLGRG